MLHIYRVVMTFRKPPQLELRVQAVSKEQALTIGREEAQRGGWGSAKKVEVSVMQ